MRGSTGLINCVAWLHAHIEDRGGGPQNDYSMQNFSNTCTTRNAISLYVYTDFHTNSLGLYACGQLVHVSVCE